MLDLLRSVYIFSSLTLEKLREIKDRLSRLEVQAGEDIIKEGEYGTQLYILEKGQVQIIKGGEVVRTLSNPVYFGERGLVFNDIRSATVRATC